MHGALGGAAQRQGAAIADQRLDLKALRLAVHGWWLGNPLVYEPGVADLCAVAYRLASAGAASGALIVGGAHNTDDTPQGDSATHHDLLQAVLILRTAVSSALIGQAAATSIAEMAQAALGLSCMSRSSGMSSFATLGHRDHRRAMPHLSARAPGCDLPGATARP